MTAFTKLPPGAPEAAEASALKAAIFAGGLKFLLLTYVLEWSESELRIQRIRKSGLDARIEAPIAWAPTSVEARPRSRHRPRRAVTPPGR